MVSQRLAKPSYLLDSLSSILSVGAIYTSSVTVARLAPTQLVRVQILGGMPTTYAVCPGGEGAVLKTVGRKACRFESCALRHIGE